MKGVAAIEGPLVAQGSNAWKVEDSVLKSGTVLELCLSGAWLLGLLQRSEGKIWRFLCWEEGVEISLRPGLRVRALLPVSE